MMIVPGCPNAVMMAGWVDPLDEFMKIANSVRFNSVDSPSFSRTTAAAGGDRDKWWVFLWFKRSELNTVQYLHGADTAGADAIYINASNKLCVDIAGTARLVSTRLFRDLAAHMGCFVLFDASNATAANRLRVSLTDTIPEITAWDTDTRSAITAGTAKTMHNSIAHVIGKNPTAASGYWGGYISEHRIGTWSGSPPSLTDHCVIHPRTGQWRPKQYNGSYGTHGSRLDFSDGSAATAAALGADRSGNGNNWTPTNLSVAAGAGCDWLTDTPTNNFPTFNQLDTTLVNDGATLSNGGLTLQTSGAGYNGCHSSLPMVSGKWYLEVAAEVVTGGANIGLDFAFTQTASYYPGFTSTSYSYRYDGQKGNNASWSAYGTAISAGDVVGVIYDADNGKLYFSRNGVVQNSGDPVAGTGYAFSGLSGAALLWIGDMSGAYPCTYQLNYGQRPFAYTPPTGFKAFCTKNRPIKPVGPMKSTSAFVAVTASGANIAATLAAARAGWSSYIDVIKRADAAEGWRFIFSDDTGNYLDTSNTSEKLAVPAFSGSSYEGFSIKVSAANGVTTGTFAHTNGVANVISDGHSTTKKAIWLHRESVGGGNWFAYHPVNSAGKLQYLNLIAGETTDASINTITAGGFTADASLPSGTYRWIAFADTPDFLSVKGRQGNASNDGSFGNQGFPPAMTIERRVTTTGNWYVLNNASSPANVNNKWVLLEKPDGEYTTPTADFVSNGLKSREYVGNFNEADLFASITFAAFPFRYANAK